MMIRGLAAALMLLTLAACSGESGRPRAVPLPPPPESFARPGLGAGQEIDLETLYGPGAGDPAAVAVAELAPSPAPPSPPPAAPGAVAIKAVALLPVEGAPGRGNEDLRSALSTVLTTAGWPVLTAPRADALAVKGRVSISPGGPGRQIVALVWTVSLPSGAPAGTVRQENQVPAGSLDQGWGAAAHDVAAATAQGLSDLVAKLR
jgi:hypothetical protein